MRNAPSPRSSRMRTARLCRTSANSTGRTCAQKRKQRSREPNARLYRRRAIIARAVTRQMQAFANGEFASLLSSTNRERDSIDAARVSTALPAHILRINRSRRRTSLGSEVARNGAFGAKERREGQRVPRDRVSEVNARSCKTGLVRVRTSSASQVGRCGSWMSAGRCSPSALVTTSASNSRGSRVVSIFEEVYKTSVARERAFLNSSL